MRRGTKKKDVEEKMLKFYLNGALLNIWCKLVAENKSSHLYRRCRSLHRVIAIGENIPRAPVHQHKVWFARKSRIHTRRAEKDDILSSRRYPFRFERLLEDDDRKQDLHLFGRLQFRQALFGGG
jgi:hypothetical protein